MVLGQVVAGEPGLVGHADQVEPLLEQRGRRRPRDALDVVEDAERRRCHVVFPKGTRGRRRVARQRSWHAVRWRRRIGGPLWRTPARWPSAAGEQTRRACGTAQELDGNDIVLGHFTLGRTFPLRERLAAARDAGVAGVGLFVLDLELHAADGLDDDELERLLRGARAAARRPRPDRPRARRRRRCVSGRSASCAAPPSSPTGSASATCRRSDRTGRGRRGRLRRDRRRARRGRRRDGAVRRGGGARVRRVHDRSRRPSRRSPRSPRAGGRTSACASTSGTTGARRTRSTSPSIPPALVRCVQMNDGPRVPEHPDYKVDCVRNRWAPGDGRDGRGRVRGDADGDGRRRAVDARGVSRRGRARPRAAATPTCSTASPPSATCWPGPAPCREVGRAAGVQVVPWCHDDGAHLDRCRRVS